MKSICFTAAALAIALSVGGDRSVAHAQVAPMTGLRANIAVGHVPGRFQDRGQMVEADDTFRGWGRNVLRVSQDFSLKEGESVRDVVAILSPATIDGHVRGDATVVFGTVRIGPKAVIDGSLIVIGGNVIVQPGAAVSRDLVVIGGGLDTPENFSVGGQHVAIGAVAIADRLHDALPWITEGLLLARPIVPRLAWVWWVTAFVFLISLALTLLFFGSVRTCANAAGARPFTTFLVGLLVLLLTGPVAVILAASVIGLAVVPFLLSAVVVAWIIGKVGVTVRLGDSMLGQSEAPTRTQTVRSLALGFGALCLAYMVPVLGFLVWGLVAVSGLGAATLAFMTAYRRENPAPPKPKPQPTPPSAPPPSYSDGSDLVGAPALRSDTPPPAFTPAPAAFDAAPPPFAAGPAVPPVTPATGLLLFPKAGFAPRAAAFAFDGVFVLILSGILGQLDHDGPGPLILIFLAYHVAFWAWKATTFGGIVCQLRIVRLDGSALRFVDALVRGIASLFSVAVVGLGWLWIIKDEEHQAWHDKIAGTYVVAVPRNWPLG